MSCKFCSKSAAKYSCPKCNSPYCSLPCYQSAGHVQCSESFYKDWIEAEIASRGPNDKSAVRKTLDTLKRVQQEEQEVEDDLDSDDDDDLAERLEGVDLEDADQVWNRLTPEERADFEKLCATGNIQNLVPEFVPWWDPSKNEAKLVEDVAEAELESLKESVRAADDDARPTFDAKSIPPLKSLIGDKPPSPLIKFSLLNVVYAYAYAVKLFGGCDDPVEFASVCLQVSANLSAGQNFDSADLAVEAAASAANQNPEISVGIEACRSVKKDVLAIVRGPTKPGEPKNGFLLSALAHLKQIFGLAVAETKKAKKKEQEVRGAKGALATSLPPWKTQICAPKNLDSSKAKLAAKKIDFYLSWASERYHEYELFYKK